MLRSWRIGSAFGIPVYVHSTFLLAPLLMLYRNGGGGGIEGALFLVALVLAVFGCVLLHEFGHALMARYFGIKTRDVTLYPIGGVARLERMSEEPHQEILIAAAGPAVNVAIAILLTPLVFLAFMTGVVSADPFQVSLGNGFWPLLANFSLGLWASNVALVLFNLIPAFPMDGGRVLRALLAMGLPFPRATEIAARVGTVMAFGLGLAGVFVFHDYMLPFVALFVAVAGQGELLAVRQRERMRQAEQREQQLYFPPLSDRSVEVQVPAPQLIYRFRAVEIPEPPR